MDDVSISGYEYTTTENAQHRYIIHAGEEFDEDSDLRLLWTEKQFNYFVFDNQSILLTLCAKPKSGSYDYFLVKFRNNSELTKWSETPGRLKSNDIDLAPKSVEDYFRGIVQKRR